MRNSPISAAGGQLARRTFLFDSLGTALSATAVALLSGRPTLASAAGASGTVDHGTDVRILNTALAAEREAVAAYEAGAQSGLLQPAALKLAAQFQGHHVEHAKLLADTIISLGGSAAEPPADYNFPLQMLRSQTDVLQFAAGLERGAVSAYAGAIPLFENRDLSQAAASILADEAMHWAILRQALSLDPVPGAFFS